MTYKICALIATYNHFNYLEKIINKLRDCKLQIFIIDDGSNLQTKLSLNQIYSKYPEIIHMELVNNSGKGAAIFFGLQQIVAYGYTHVLQIDADGQHSLDGLQYFLEISNTNPGALISGHPIYDQSISVARRIGRWFTHVWVWIETLSFRITDSMCGMRIYPLVETLQVMTKHNVGKRMDFDTDIIVRLFWRGVPVIMSPVKVIYPSGNISNFNMLKDNWRISKMHTRLFFTMLINLPKIIANRPDYTALKLNPKTMHWSSLNERGSIVGMLLLIIIYKILGRYVCQIIGSLVVVYFYIVGETQRKASHEFLQKIFLYRGTINKPTHIDGLRHFNSFFNMMLDKIEAWSGHVSLDNLNQTSVYDLTKLLSKKQGGMLLVSHLGNIEFCRALISSEHSNRLHVLLHSKNSLRFNAMLRAVNPSYRLNIIEVTEIGLETILWLKNCIEQGDWIAIAADRVAINDNDRVSKVKFLGSEANFAQGPYILASLLECQVYSIIAVYDKNQYKVDVSNFAEIIKIDRTKRELQLQQLAQQYANYLESYCLKYPYQWYNFFDFWKAV